MDDHQEFALKLLTLAGAIMEDASAMAIIGHGDMSLSDRAATVAGAAADAHILAQAVAIALRQR